MENVIHQQAPECGGNCNRVLEEAAKLCELSSDSLRLLAGEMTAQEMRTVKAVLSSRAAAIRSMKVV